MRLGLYLTLVVILSGIQLSYAGNMEELKREIGAINPDEDPVAFAKTVYKAYKVGKASPGQEIDPQYAQLLVKKERRRIEEGSICVDCPNLILLTDQVNSVLQHLVNDPNNEAPVDVLSEVNSLEGMFYFTKEEIKQGNLQSTEVPCTRIEFPDPRGPLRAKQSFDADNHVLIFSKNINFKNILQVHLLEPGVRKTYFFRAKYPHEDVVVRVMRDSKGNTQVNYYRNRNLVAEAKKKQEQKEIAALTPFERKLRLEEEAKRKKLAEEKAKEDRLNVDYGWNTEGSGVLPSKVTVLATKKRQPGVVSN